MQYTIYIQESDAQGITSQAMVGIKYILNFYLSSCYRYGFDYGCIHFVVMNAEDNFTIGTEQYNFLVRHLQSVNRTTTPWLIFTGHRLVISDTLSELQRL